MDSNSKQVGGDHYKHDVQPWDVIVVWEDQGLIGYLEGTAIKYIARHRRKNRAEDLKKAIHFLEKAIEVYYPQKRNYDHQPLLNLQNTWLNKEK